MEELLLVEAYREGFSLVWSHLQWWASISFGLLALASLGRKHLALSTVIGLSVLYFLFSLFTIGNMFFALVPAWAAVGDLRELQATGSIYGIGEAPIWLEENISVYNGMIVGACFLATFLGVLAYLWYSYRENVRAKQSS